MKLLIICGSHSRHAFILKDLIKKADEIFVIQIEREELLPSSKNIKNKILKNIFEMHFNLRYEKEAKAFGKHSLLDSDALSIKPTVEYFLIKPHELNSAKVINKIKELKSDFCVIMGATLFGPKLVSVLPKKHFNVHLGLSPWYRGSATLFWPTFNLEPWKTGVTFHRIDSQIDTGPIYHQTNVELSKSFGVHDTAIAAIKNAQNSLLDLVSYILENNPRPIAQPFTGRTHLSTQVKPEHLFEIYERRKDKTILNLKELGITGHNFKVYSILPSKL